MNLKHWLFWYSIRKTKNGYSIIRYRYLIPKTIAKFYSLPMAHNYILGKLITLQDIFDKKMPKIVLPKKERYTALSFNSRTNGSEPFNSRANRDEASKCRVPPFGWYCTRKKNHSGTCAAIPVWWNKILRWFTKIFQKTT